MAITKSMSESKNTALGNLAGFGYSHGRPAKLPRHSPPNHAMITVTLILAALAFLISTDEPSSQDLS